MTGIFSSSVLQAGNWGKDSLWNDGRAEVAIYDSERIVDGKPRQFKEQIITVKEEVRPETWTKLDDPKKQKGVRALKMNQIQRFDVDNYAVSYLSTVLVKDDQLQQVLKYSASTQDWEGNSFKLYKAGADVNTGELVTHSYNDGEADQSYNIARAKDDYFEDQLPLALRGLPFKEGYEQKIKVVDSMMVNRSTAPNMSEALVTVAGREAVRCRAGSIDSWIVTIKRPKGTDTYWFEKAEPNILVKMETYDGRKRSLYGRARWMYWDKRFPKPFALN